MSRKTTAWRRVARQHGVRMSSRPGELDERVYDLIPHTNNPLPVDGPRVSKRRTNEQLNVRRAHKRQRMLRAMTTPRKGR